MSNNRNRNNRGKEQGMFSCYGVDPTTEISKHLGKGGKNLKNCSKREKQALRSICPHQVINRKGNIKPRFEKAGEKGGEDYLRCPICGEQYKASFYTDIEYEKAYNNYKPILSQAKMIAAALNVDKQTIQQVSETNIYVDRFGKVYKNMRKVAQKKEEVRNKKKKKRNYQRMGSWDIN